jgi:hypothetical protein
MTSTSFIAGTLLTSGTVGPPRGHRPGPGEAVRRPIRVIGSGPACFPQPLTSPFASRARGSIKHGIAEGARLNTVARNDPKGRKGILRPPDRSRRRQELHDDRPKGIFGPALCVVGYADEDDTVRRPP